MKPLSTPDETLLSRIQKFVARDINSRVVLGGDDKQYEVKPLDVFIVSFTRVLNTWVIEATAESDVASFYKLIHDGDTETTICHIYIKHVTIPAVI